MVVTNIGINVFAHPGNDNAHMKTLLYLLLLGLVASALAQSCAIDADCPAIDPICAEVEPCGQCVCFGGTCVVENLLPNGELCQHPLFDGICHQSICEFEFCQTSLASCSYGIGPTGGCDPNQFTADAPAKCDDGIFCTEFDQCDVSGVCSGFPFDQICHDGKVCTNDVCSPTAGCLFPPKNDNTQCNDGFYCNVGETCQSGECTGGSVNTCDDQDECTEDSCDEIADQCVNMPITGCCTTDAQCDNEPICQLSTISGCGSCLCISNSCVPTEGPGPIQGSDCSTVGGQTPDGRCFGGLCYASSCQTNPCRFGVDDGINCNPLQYPVADGLSCDDGFWCNGDETCLAGLCTSGSRNCDDQIGCTVDSCDENADQCVNTPSDQICEDAIPPLNDCQQSLCRPSNQASDANGCRNTPLPSTTECLEAAGDCDVAEFCDGINFQCPQDDKLGPNDPPCRDSSGPCDIAEVCDGVNDDCPSDEVEPDTVTCNPGLGSPNGGVVCDPPELCDGTTKQCPPNMVAPLGTVCRVGSGDLCDTDETCSGVAEQPCPADDAPANAGVECRAGDGSPNDGSECNPAERCTGVPGEACPDDSCNVGGVCRPSAGQCDVIDRCPSSEECDGAVCPENHFKPHGTSCDEMDSNTCTIGECSGSSSDCHTVVLDDGTPCASPCGDDATCLQGQCVCPCEVDCAYTKGSYANRAPCENKGNQETDPAWNAEGIDHIEICGYTLCELMTAKGNNKHVSGSAKVLAENWGAVTLTLAAQIDNQGFLCSGPQPAQVDQVYDSATVAIFNDTDFCSRTDYPLYNDWAEVLSDWSEGKYADVGGPVHCKESGKPSRSVTSAHGDDPYGISASFSAGYSVSPVGCASASPQVSEDTAAIVLCHNEPSETVGSVLISVEQGSIVRTERRAVLALMIATAKATGGYLTPVRVQDTYTHWAATQGACGAGSLPAEFGGYVTGDYCMLDGPCMCNSAELQQRIANTPRQVSSVADIPHIKLQEQATTETLDDDNDLSTGAIVGIVLGSIAAVVLLVLALGCFVFYTPAIQNAQKRYVGAEMGYQPAQSDMEE